MMTKEQAIEEINKAFEPAFANYIITALTEGATVSDRALEQQPSDDCVSRLELLKAMDTWDKFGNSCHNMFRLDNNQLNDYVPYVKYEDMVNCVKNTPPVTPTRNVGKWIYHEIEDISRWLECSEYGYEIPNIDINYCPNCGAEMKGAENG